MKSKLKKGIKYDAGKPRWSLLPFREMDEVVKVLTFGSKKYDDENWKKIEPERYQSALGRHYSLYMQGEKNDKESGLSHLAHLICCALFLMWHEFKNKAVYIGEQYIRITKRGE
jgi:hypothetical protein